MGDCVATGGSSGFTVGPCVGAHQRGSVSLCGRHWAYFCVPCVSALLSVSLVCLAVAVAVAVCGVAGSLFGQLTYKMSLPMPVLHSALLGGIVSIVSVFGRDWALGSKDL